MESLKALSQIPTLSQLYQSGGLDPPVLSVPSYGTATAPVTRPQ